MTYGELCLIRFILENVKEGNKVTISDDEKVDVDSLYDYFNNVITEIEKEKAKNPRIKYQAIRLLVDVSKVRGVEDVKERVDEKEKDPEKGEEGQGKQSKDSRPGVEHTKDEKSGEHSRENRREKV